MGVGSVKRGGNRVRLQGMGPESHIGSMGFECRVYKSLGSATTMAGFSGMVLPRLLSNIILNFTMNCIQQQCVLTWKGVL